MVKQHLTVVDAVTQHERDLGDGRASGQWLTLVAFITPQGLELRKTSWHFPLGALSAMQEQLTALLTAENSHIEQPQPLPVAKLFEQLMTTAEPLPEPAETQEVDV